MRSAGSDTYNYVNPAQRDVVSTGTSGDNVTIRFRTDNPGPWFLHCHIDYHLDAGLAIVFAEDVDDVSSDITPDCECRFLAGAIIMMTDGACFTAAWDELCPTYNATYLR